ncbi:hypothetical protein QT990_23755 [Microcoleus sp. T3_B1]|uniref:hypothetical protein n=1 Tax=Microcoleus sp. T3_B1 TaxID=3055425 RepID=UPI002FD386A8
MNCFPIIKSVLDEAYVQIPGDEAKKDEVINDALEDLRGEYSHLSQEGNIDYSAPRLTGLSPRQMKMISPSNNVAIELWTFKINLNCIACL